MHNSIWIVLFKDFSKFFRFCNVGFFENVIGFVFDVLQVFQISCVRKCIKVDDLCFRIIFYKFSYHVRTDKAGSACDDYIFHLINLKLFYVLYFYNKNHSAQEFPADTYFVRRKLPYCSFFLPSFRNSDF